MEENEKDNIKLLFHGAKGDIIFPLDLNHSKETNDFGIGFYLGENFSQASTYISNSISKYVYAFSLNLNNLKISKFNVDSEWMLAIAYYRGWLTNYSNGEIIKNIIKKVEESDIIIAPIADNRMFDLISEFVEGSITNKQCEHALAATNLGNQYVVKTQKGLENLLLFSNLLFLYSSFSLLDKKHFFNNNKFSNPF